MVRKGAPVFPSLRLEGSLLSTPAMLDAVAAARAAEQQEKHYGIRAGLTLREECSLSFRVGKAHYAAFAKAKTPGRAAAVEFARGLLREAFGFDDLVDAPLPLAMVAGRRAPVVVAETETLERRSEALSTERALSPAFALQEHLDRNPQEALWGIATNGKTLRLMRGNASFTRPACVEADLEHIFANDDFASFTALWLLVHRTRFGKEGAAAADCPLERWREAGAREGVAARNRLAGQVKLALKTLGDGFLEAEPHLADSLQSGQTDLTDWFNELLRLVYRLIFVMVAEDRELLHPKKSNGEARKRYARGYSLQAQREQCRRSITWDRHHDRYEGVKVVFRALAAGQPELALPALGGLFAEEQLPSLGGSARLPNRNFMKALYQLAWLTEGGSSVPVNWRAMATEELGSVYESLLELKPQLGDGGRSLVFASDSDEKKGSQRKATGSYYTPDSLVQALLDSALNPVLDKAEAEAADPAKALLKLSVIDPACGSGHFLLGAARRIANRVARHRAGGAPSEDDHRQALRDVVRRCIHGVDRNPSAVELTKVALWIESVDPGRPLGFLDAQIRCGDSLLGVFDLEVLQEGIPDAAYKPLSGDSKGVAKLCLKANKEALSGQLRLVGDAGSMPPSPLPGKFSVMRERPEESVDDVRKKGVAYKDLREEDRFKRDRMACDLYVAAFLLPKTGEVRYSDNDLPVPTSGDVWHALKTDGSDAEEIGQKSQKAAAARAFHWPLEFPDKMERGGFDVVIGNPPWERIKLQEQEFFATRDPEIATAANKAARDRLIKSLRVAGSGSARRALFEEFEAEKRLSEAVSTFVRVDAGEGGRFPDTGTGDVNTYALFAELFANLARQRAGVIVPTGIATDATTAPFFARLVEEKRLSSLIDFENRAGLFPAVDSRMKFCLLTLGRNEPEARFAFFLHAPVNAELAEPERNFTLSPEQIAAINPNTRTAPVFRSRADAELTAKIYSNAPVLIDENRGPAGNPWGISFMAMFHMSNDSVLFRTVADLAAAGFIRDGTDWIAAGAQPGQGALAAEGAGAGTLDLHDADSHSPQRYVPLYEAKMIHQFDHRWASAGDDEEDEGDGSRREQTWEPSPRYWVPSSEVSSRLDQAGWSASWLLGHRGLTNATNERTFITSIFPNVGVGHSLPVWVIPKTISTAAIAGLYANTASLVVDFAARQKVGGTNLSFFLVYQFPVLLPDFYTEPRLAFITPRVLELTYTSHSLAPFARDLGHDGPPFAWDEGRRAQLRADLDAFYARAYGLTRDELRYILDPADVKGADYPSETFRVLKEKEIREHGEYRTRRLVLEAWDRMEGAGEFAALGL